MLLAITHSNSIIRLESRHLTISNDGILNGIVPLNLLSRVLLPDIMSISGALIQALLQRHIPIILLSADGKYIGQMHYTPSGDNERKILQYKFALTGNILPAQQLLNAKLYNQKRVLQRLATSHKTVCTASRMLDKLQKQLHSKTSLEALRGIEGLAAKEYFHSLSGYIPNWCNFTGRRRPATDPFNAVLSYSYAVMSGELENLVRLHLLEPGMGFLHQRSYNTPCLVLDLLEVFRACYCDMLVIGLFNHRQLRQEHFDYTSDNGQFRLNRTGKKIFFTAWERKRKSSLLLEGKRTSWQEIWNRQVLIWVNFLEHSNDIKFFRMQ